MNFVSQLGSQPTLSVNSPTTGNRPSLLGRRAPVPASPTTPTAPPTVGSTFTGLRVPDAAVAPTSRITTSQAPVRPPENFNFINSSHLSTTTPVMTPASALSAETLRTDVNFDNNSVAPLFGI